MLHRKNQVQDLTLLKSCVLWQGSKFEMDEKYLGSVSVESVQQKVEVYERADDLTSNEVEMLQALKQTLAIHS